MIRIIDCDVCPNVEIVTLDRNNGLEMSVLKTTRVNEFLRCEAEQGRAHGDGCIENGYWSLNEGKVRIALHQCYCQNQSFKVINYPFDCYISGNPVVEAVSYNGFCSQAYCLNNRVEWMTPFLYLRASALAQNIKERPGVNCYGLSKFEEYQVDYLAAQWGLDGKWDSRNQIGEGSWQPIHGATIYLPDSYAHADAMRGENGEVKYGFELLNMPEGNILLPYQFFKRQGFLGPRRLFLPPEGSAAIYGADRIKKSSLRNVLLTDEYGIALCNPEVPVGCLLADFAAILETDATPLQNKVVHWLILQESAEDFSRAIKVALWLKRNRIPVHFLRVSGRWQAKILLLGQRSYPVRELIDCCKQELVLDGLIHAARQYGVDIPMELRNDSSEITATLKAFTFQPIVSEILHVGEVVSIFESDDGVPSLLLASHIGLSLAKKQDIFAEHWEVRYENETVIFVADWEIATAAKYLSRHPKELRICDYRFMNTAADQQLECFRTAVGNAKVIIFTGIEPFGHIEAFTAVLKWCRTQKIGVFITCPTHESSVANGYKRINGVVTRNFKAMSLEHSEYIAIALIDSQRCASLEVIFDRERHLIEAKPLTSTKEDYLRTDSGSFKASPPLEVGVFEDLRKKSFTVSAEEAPSGLF